MFKPKTFADFMWAFRLHVEVEVNTIRGVITGIKHASRSCEWDDFGHDFIVSIKQYNEDSMKNKNILLAIHIDDPIDIAITVHD